MKKLFLLILTLSLILTAASCIRKDFADETKTQESTQSPADTTLNDPSTTGFPNLSDSKFDSLVTLGDLATLSLPADTNAYAAKNLYDAYYTSYTKTITNRAAQSGDMVNIDYTGYLDNVAFEGGTATDQKIFVVGNSGYIPGFAEGIVSHNVGEEFDVNVTFPEEYHAKDLAGKAVVFKMKLNAIYDLTLTDDTVKDLTENQYESYDELLQIYKKKYAAPKLLQALTQSSQFSEIPKECYFFFADYYRNMYRSYASSYGISYEEFIAMNNLTEADIDEMGKEESKIYLVAHTLAKQNGFEISETTLDAKWNDYIENLMAENNCSREEAEKKVANGERNMLLTDLTYQAAQNWLFEKVTE